VSERAAADLVRLLATELAAFRRYERQGGRHLARTVFDVSYCASEADPRFARPCTPRCQGVGTALELAARWLDCEVNAFYPAPKARRRRTVQTRVP
jgi:hypothetical protein